MSPDLRIARPVRDLGRSAAMYRRGLGLAELGRFEDHAGFSGVMLGDPGQNFHFELTCCPAHPVQPAPTVEDLLVFYIPEESAWRERCDAMLAAGFREARSFNPYWQERGRTFEDPDGYRVVIQQAAWKAGTVLAGDEGPPGGALDSTIGSSRLES
jgi:catechol 2,3-dioxygenase-like lactoylglutathione lyase family enzyme